MKAFTSYKVIGVKVRFEHRAAWAKSYCWPSDRVGKESSERRLELDLGGRIEFMMERSGEHV